MEKAKQAVANFVSRDGKHTTTVDENVRAAVTDEHVRPHEHEEVVTAVDKEVHQDHHHTTVQPVTVKEKLCVKCAGLLSSMANQCVTRPEEHSHRAIPVQHQTYEHGNKQDVQDFLESDANKYQDNSYTHEATYSTSTAPIVSGQRVHHHIHEHIQPVVQKETIAPRVVHTTIPVHETHQAAAVQHGTTTLPPKTLDEFTNDHGSLGGRHTHKVNEFEGCPTVDDKHLHTEEAKSASEAY